MKVLPSWKLWKLAAGMGNRGTGDTDSEDEGMADFFRSMGHGRYGNEGMTDFYRSMGHGKYGNTASDGDSMCSAHNFCVHFRVQN